MGRGSNISGCLGTCGLFGIRKSCGIGRSYGRGSSWHFPTCCLCGMSKSFGLGFSWHLATCGLFGIGKSFGIGRSCRPLLPISEPP